MKDKSINRSITFIAPYAYPLLTGNVGGPGGAERQFFLFGRELARRGWRVSFITEKDSSSDKSCKTEFPVFQADFSYMGGSNTRLPRCWASLWRALKKADSTYYVIKTPAHLMLPVGLFSHLTRRKLVFWAQTTFGDNLPLSSNSGISVSFMERRGLKLADMVITQTINQKKAILEKYNLNVELVRSICGALDGLPVDDNFHNFDTATDIDVLWVGNTSKNKRAEVLFKLTEMLPDVSFAMAMNKNSEQRFEILKEKARDIPNLDFLDMVPPAEMESWFRRAKIFLNTSIREGFPNTFLQAWMNGVPVVSLNIDPDEVIKKFNLGRVVGIESVSACNENAARMAELLVPLIRKISTDSAMREDMGKQAKNYIKTHHAPDVVAHELMKALSQPS